MELCHFPELLGHDPCSELTYRIVTGVVTSCPISIVAILLIGEEYSIENSTTEKLELRLSKGFLDNS
jgi:hypothetical protein